MPSELPASDADPQDARPTILLAAASGARAEIEEALAAEYGVLRATDASAAAVSARDVDLVITDAALPGPGGGSLASALRSDSALAGTPVLLLAGPGSDVETELAAGVDDFVVPPHSAAEVLARVSALLLRREASSGLADSPVMDALPDPVVITDAHGAVIHLNEAFTGLLGWRLDDGPFASAHPWWPSGRPTVERGEAELRARDGRTVWAWVTTNPDGPPTEDGPSRILVLRDVTREHASRMRRASAAELAGRFASAQDLTAVLIAAVDGFTELFDGDSVVDIATGGDTSLFTASGPVPDVASLPEELRAIPDENPTQGQKLDGILLKPHGNDTFRAWVRFGTPRIVPEDEIIVGSLLADAMALAVDRVTAADEFATRTHHLQQAIDSHRAIGQAIGILVERHRLTPRQAFARLSKTSQDTNTKVRDLAARLVETGQEG
ncbi:MAG: ANTAR domain-containing protein [Actinomycetes bacterium]